MQIFFLFEKLAPKIWGRQGRVLGMDRHERRA